MAIKNLKGKIWMRQRQKEARELMGFTSRIWEKEGWKSGSDVNINLLKQKLVGKYGKKKFNPVISEILEDANYHSENQALQELGLVKYKGTLLKKYRKLGGKTWEL
jgi:hypothetical protein